jgi:hypothetical protein
VRTRISKKGAVVGIRGRLDSPETTLETGPRSRVDLPSIIEG